MPIAISQNKSASRIPSAPNHSAGSHQTACAIRPSSVQIARHLRAAHTNCFLLSPPAPQNQTPGNSPAPAFVVADLQVGDFLFACFLALFQGLSLRKSAP